MDDGNLNAFHFNLLQGSRQGFYRTLHISLDDNIDRLNFASFEGIKEIFQTDTVSSLTLFEKGTFGTFFTGCTRSFFIFIDRKVVTSHRSFIETSDRNRCRWSCHLNTTAQVIGHSPNPTEGITNNDWILHIQSSLLNQKGCDSTFSFIQTSFDNCTNRSNSRIRLELLNFSHQEDCFQQAVDILIEFR